MALADESTVQKWSQLSLLACYVTHSYGIGYISVTVKDLELSQGFGNSHSLSAIVIKLDVIKNVLDKWDTKNRVFRFGTVKNYHTREQYESLMLSHMIVKSHYPVLWAEL